MLVSFIYYSKKGRGEGKCPICLSWLCHWECSIMLVDEVGGYAMEVEVVLSIKLDYSD